MWEVFVDDSRGLQDAVKANACITAAALVGGNYYTATRPDFLCPLTSIEAGMFTVFYVATVPTRFGAKCFRALHIVEDVEILVFPQTTDIYTQVL